MRSLFSFCMTLVFGILVFSANAQLDENYFYDREGKSGGRVNDYIKGEDHLIISGRSFNNRKYMPSISKVDTLGNTLWSTTTVDTTSYPVNDAFVDQIIAADSSIYAICIYDEFNDYKKEIWKIDSANGTIVWKTPLTSYDNSIPAHLLNFNQDAILVSYTSNYDGFDNSNHIAFINKQTGNIDSTQSIGDVSWKREEQGLAVDNENNIYFTKHDTIVKRNPSKPDSFIWKTRHPSVDIKDFQGIHMGSGDSLYLFGRENSPGPESGLVLSVHQNDGSINWMAENLSGDARLRQMMVKGDYIYATWRHSLVGGGSTYYWTNKIHKDTGGIAWHSNFSFHWGGGESAMSFDLDQNGDMYLTGYYGDANFGPENWGIVKLDGDNGEAIYETTITQDTAIQDDISVGKVAAVFNNKPYFVGELETYHKKYYERSKTTFLKLEPQNGDLLKQKFINGNYQFPSHTLEFHNYGADKILAFKQKGRFSELAMYDSDDSLLWNNAFEENYMLFGKDVAILPNGRIAFSAYGVGIKDAPPYYSKTKDSIYLFVLDSTGNLTDKNNFEVSNNNAHSTEIANDGSNNPVLLYRKNNGLFLRKMDENGWTQEQSLNLEPSVVFSHNQQIVQHSDTELFIFGKDGSSNRAIKFNTNTLDTSILGSIPQIQKINHVKKSDTSNVIICGQNKSGAGTLISYSTSQMDTNWVKTFPDNAEILKFILDKNTNFIYALSGGATNATIHKMGSGNGVQNWSYELQDSANFKNRPMDLALDPDANQITVTGYQKDSTANSEMEQAFIKVINIDGGHHQTHIRKGNLIGQNRGTYAKKVNDDNIWIGGQLNHSGYGPAGFIYQFNPNTTNFEKKVHDQNTFSNIKAYPNPFSNLLNVEYSITKNESNVKIELLDLNGRQVYLNSRESLEKGYYQQKINAQKLTGIHILRLTINNQVKTQKLLGVN